MLKYGGGFMVRPFSSSISAMAFEGEAGQPGLME
jgi:hypothetical protein